MAYTINLTNGSVLTTVADATINTSATSLTLIGRNYPRYGEIQNENFIKLLESFADTSSPNNAVTGQLWYDANGSISRLKVYDGTRFKEVGSAIVSSSEPSYANNGDFWVKTTTGQLYVKTASSTASSAFRLIGPLADPAEGSNGFVQETISDGTSTHKVLSLYVGDTRVAIFNKDAEFTPSPSITGFTSVTPGVNLNSNISAILNGTAATASAVDAGGITGYLPSDTNGTTTGTLSVANNGGLYVGTTNQFNVGVSSGNVTLKNTVNSGKIYLTARSSAGTDTNVVTVQNGTGYVGILVDPPTVPLDVNGVIKTNSELRAASSTGVSVGSSQQGYLSVETNNVVLRNAYPNAQLLLRTVVGSSNTDVIKIDPQGDSGSLWTVVTSKVVPGLNNAYDLGSSSLKWANVYTQNASIGGTLTVGTLNATTITGTFTGTVSSSSPLSSSSVTKTGTTGVGDIGQSSNRFGTVYATTFNGTASQAQYADLAEKYLADDNYEVGTVMVIGGDAEVTASSINKRAIGAVSAAPAYLMNKDLEGGTVVALKGRIPVKVLGPVAKGDRLIAGPKGAAVSCEAHLPGIIDLTDTSTDSYDSFVFAIALQDSDDAGVKLVEAVIL